MRICLLSSERSGSNLLRLMLDSHSQIYGPPAPQIARILAPYLHRYGNLSRVSVLRALVQDMLTLTRVHPAPWPQALTVEDVCDYVSKPSFWFVFDAVYTRGAHLAGKKYWFSKENNLFDFAFELLYHFADIKFIYLVRDGRDYACSMRRASGHRFHYFFLAQQWQQEQTHCLRIYEQLRDEQKIILLRYEDLLTTPEATLKKLTDFLGIKYENSILDYHTRSSAKHVAAQSQYWQNLSKPVLTDNFGKFKESMTPKDIRLFETIAGQELSCLGYECLNNGDPVHLTSWQKRWFAVEDWYQQRRHRAEYMSEPNRVERATAIRAIHSRLQNGLRLEN